MTSEAEKKTILNEETLEGVSGGMDMPDASGLRPARQAKTASRPRDGLEGRIDYHQVPVSSEKPFL